MQVCAAGPGLIQKLGRVLREKAQGDLDRVFNGASKTRERLGVGLWLCLSLHICCHLSTLLGKTCADLHRFGVLQVVEELFTYWSLEDADDTLEELEEALIVRQNLFAHYIVCHVTSILLQ